MASKLKNRVGEIRFNKQGFKMECVEYISSDKIKVQIKVELNKVEYCICKYSNWTSFNKGCVRFNEFEIEGVIYKKCTRCGKILPKENNYRGTNGMCNDCDRERDKLNHRKRKDELSKYHKKYYQENKEKVREKQNEWIENNKENLKEYSKNYRLINKEEISKRNKKYYQENKKRINEYTRIYLNENPHYRFNTHVNRRSREEQGGITTEQWKECLDYFHWTCAYSGEYIGGNKTDRTLDHIIPLYAGGKNEIWNLIPMKRNYNCSKKERLPMEWYKEQEYYDEDRVNKIKEWQLYAFNKYSNEDDNLTLIDDELIG